MQNLATGDIVPVDSESQADKDAAIPERAQQGPVLRIGEVVELKGGSFRVQAITEKRVYLDSIPTDKAVALAKAQTEHRLSELQTQIANQQLERKPQALEGNSLPPDVRRGILQEIIKQRLPLMLIGSGVERDLITLQLALQLVVPVATLKHWLEHRGEHVETADLDNAESLKLRLQRYEFEEAEATKEDLAKTYGREIMAAAEADKTSSDYRRYNEALELVGERHAKYDLVDLVYWLLGQRRVCAHAVQAASDALEQYRNDMLDTNPLDEGQRTRRVEMIEKALATLEAQGA